MSERKTIQINPEMFKVSKNTTRKKQPKSPKIELKSELKTQKQKTLRKNVLKMIREKQQEAYRELFDKRKPDSNTKPGPSDFDKDFDTSLQFFSSLADKVKTDPPVPPPNTTFKHYPPLANSIAPSINMPAPTLVNTLPIADTAPISLAPFPTDQIPIYRPPNTRPAPLPLYGCLKNGTLPTYRNYTRKNTAEGTSYTEGTRYAEGNQSFMTNQPPPFEKNIFDTPVLSRGGGAFAEQSQKFEKIHQGSIQREPDNKKEKQKQKIRYRKRKKIFKRTYKVGRSKIEPKIGVLVSNKTIRSRITTEAQLLKQTPIHDVRKFLIKKGFIKVGTNAPNDVLRKMYETVSLVCGEIQNHNPENLLYNYIHDKD